MTIMGVRSARTIVGDRRSLVMTIDVRRIDTIFAGEILGFDSNVAPCM